jgi:hypothetical protein
VLIMVGLFSVALSMLLLLHVYMGRRKDTSPYRSLQFIHPQDIFRLPGR